MLFVTTFGVVALILFLLIVLSKSNNYEYFKYKKDEFDI